MEPRLTSIRAKKIGLFIREARERHNQTLENCARWLGINVDNYQSFEEGSSSPSLPQLESLAHFFDCSFDQLTYGESQILEKRFLDLSKNLEWIKLRDRIVAVTLQQIRLESKLSLQKLELETGLSVIDLESYENGDAPIPFPTLETVIKAFGITPNQFFSQQEPFSHVEDENPRPETQLADGLSPELVEFISKPVNRPYLDLAIHLSKMEAEKLRSIAASLLEITY